MLSLADKLRALDGDLCDYMCANMAQMLDPPRPLPRRELDLVDMGPLGGVDSDGREFPAHYWYLKESVPPQVFRRVADARTLVHPKVLLDADDMQILIDTADCCQLQPGLRWIADRLLHRRAADTFGETAEWAKWVGGKKRGGELANWKACCVRISPALGKSGLPLATGLGWVKEWVRLIRAYQMEMERPDLTPAPVGASPAAAARHCPSVSRPDPETDARAELYRNPTRKIKDLMKYLRPVIAGMEGEVTCKAIIKAAGGNRKDLLFAIQCLRFRGELPVAERRPGVSALTRDGHRVHA